MRGLSKAYQTTVFLLLTVCCLSCSPANATYHNVYSNCIKGYEFSDNAIDAIVLTPLNYVCQKRCKNECGAFSRTIKISDHPKSPSLELNEDVIHDCMQACQAGEIFESYYHEAKPRVSYNAPISKELKGPVKIGVACSGTRQAIAQNAARTRFTVKNGDQIKISITGRTADSSKVYLCGKKKLTLTPIFPNINSQYFTVNADIWKDTQTPPKMWSKKTDHPCLARLSDGEFSKLSNLAMWSTRMGNDRCDWHARNPNHTHTGLYLADGDELSISWYGEYVIDQINKRPASRQELVDCVGNPNVAAEAKEVCKVLLYKSSAIAIKSATSPNETVLYGEQFRPQNTPMGTVPMNSTEKEKTPDSSTLYLTGKLLDEGLVTAFKSNIEGCNENSQADYSKPECIEIKEYGRSRYSVSGTLQSFSATRSELTLRHYEDINKPYSEHLGGYNIDIEWGGCPFQEGARMQYAIVSENNTTTQVSTYDHIPAIQETAWKDVPRELLESNKPLQIENTEAPGSLFLRIKPLAAPAGASEEIRELYENPSNYHGQYYILVEQLNVSDTVVQDGPIIQIVRTVTDVLLGKNRSAGEVTASGVIPKLYSGVAQNPKFINLIRTLVVMYLAFVGIGFVLGLIKANYHELIKRVLKIGFVLTLISPTSWQFFGGYLVPLCIDGTTELIANVMSGSQSIETFGIQSSTLIKEPYLVFTTFDAPLKIMLSSAVWKKIVAILFDGLMGFILCVVIIAAIIIYFITIFKVMTLYLVSIIVMSLLIIIMPVVFPFILFQNTKQIFDQWAKSLISFALQPIFCFAGISLFNLLIITLLKTVLSFTACPNCILYINLAPLYEACWIPGYTAVANLHTPADAASGMSRLMGQFSSGLAFLIIVHSAYIFSTFMALIASTIVTGSPIRSASAAGAAETGEAFAMNQAKKFTSSTTGFLSNTAVGIMNYRDKKNAENRTETKNLAETQNRSDSR